MNINQSDQVIKWVVIILGIFALFLVVSVELSASKNGKQVGFIRARAETNYENFCYQEGYTKVFRASGNKYCSKIVNGTETVVKIDEENYELKIK